MAWFQHIMRYLFGLMFIAAGVMHFLKPAVYVRIMPPYLPIPLTLVYASGVAEVLLGFFLFVPRVTTLAAWGLIALLIAVFPANLHMAMNPDKFPDIPTSLLYVRLPLQVLLIAWAYMLTSIAGAPSPNPRG